MTLHQYLDLWLPSHCVGLKPKTTECYTQTVHTIKKQTPDIPLDELTPLTVPMIYAKQIEKGNYRTAQLIYTVLAIAMKKALDMGLIDKNVMKSVKKPRNITQKQIKYLTAEQAAKLLDYDSKYQIAWAIALLAGLRIGEIAASKWSCLSEGKISVLRTLSRVNGQTVEGTPKSEAGKRSVPICDKLSQYLMSAQVSQRKNCLRQGIPWSKECYIITETGERIADTRYLNRVLTRDLEKLQLPHVSCHGLRHTYATAAVAAGVEMRVLQYLLGHESITTTARYYAHVPYKVLCKANTAIANIYAT